MSVSSAHITVVMATKNGAGLLPAQLNSLLGQTHRNWSLLISDDGSSDETLSIVRAFGARHPDHALRLVRGPGQGPASNFLAALAHPDLPRGLVALADQDDVWLPDKLSRAAECLGKSPEDVPAIYAAESVLTDAALFPVRTSREPKARPGFRNALVQNLFAGHNTVLNRAAVDLARRAGRPAGIAFHDWWLYQLVAGAGGACILDAAGTTLYRQHGANAFGGNHGIAAGLRRLGQIASNDYASWLAGHWRALEQVSPLLTADARALLRDLTASRTGPDRALRLCDLGLRRSSRRGTAALLVAAALGMV